ncbi:MAG: hypothetical protein WCA83_04300 [Azonexus sp.]
MKQNILTALVVLSLGVGGSALAANSAAQDHSHNHGGKPATLQLNAGKKWETDAPLRKAIGEIRQSMSASLDAIHNNRLPAKDYGALAQKVESAVGDMVANCKLGPQADEQLHIIIADLLAGAEQMSGKAKQAKPRDGAVKVIVALDNYGKYFDDADFQPFKH